MCIRDSSYIAAVKLAHAPSTLCLSRQDLPCLEHSSREGVAKGAYVVRPEPQPGTLHVVIVATGSEVSIAMDAAAALAEKKGIVARVVSMPCNRLFDEQPVAYKLEVFPARVPVVSIEAASVEGWAKYAHVQVGMTTFGKSAPYKEVYKYLGLDKDSLVDKVAKTVEFYKGKEVLSLVDVPQF